MAKFTPKKAMVARSRFQKLTISLVVFLVVIVGMVAVVRRYYDENVKAVSSSQKAVTVAIPSGSTVHEIAVLLKQKGLIRNVRVFEQYVRNKNQQNQLQAGTYSLRPSQNVAEIVDILTNGHILKNLFTILPAQRLDQIKSAMINSGFNASAVEAAFNPEKYKGNPALVDKPVGASLEGYLYPESFQKTSNTTPEDIIRLSLDQMQLHLTPELRAAFVAQGLTTYQGVTLASIVEQEVSTGPDRPQVAQVFLKRFRENMMLGSDVTAFYGSTMAGVVPSVNYDSPYNTRIHTGLPPGPISNVSESSLQAVAYPATTDWLYFVSGDDGKTYFSHTLEEHDALTKQYCKKLCN
jgi:UPF0755 protein